MWLDLKINDIFPYLKNPDGTWNDDLVNGLKKLQEFGLEDFILYSNHEKIIFYISDSNIEKMILELFFPLYIGKSIFDDIIQSLPKPLVPLNVMYNTLVNLRKPLTAEVCSSGYIFNCGESINQTHTRLCLGYDNYDYLAIWVWNSLRCFRFVRVSSSASDYSDSEEKFY